MDPFPDRSAFPGPVVDLAAARPRFAGQARFNGFVVLMDWERADVARLLPAELELAENTSGMPHRHPVVLLFGEQTEGAVIFAGLTVPMGPDYGEFAIAVPYVRHRHGRYLHVHVPRMYSSYFPATWSGNAYYGFAKAMASMAWEGPTFMMRSAAGDSLLHAEVEPAGSWSRAARELSGLRALFSLPVVGRRADASLVSSYWDLDFQDALARPAHVRVSIDAPLVEGLASRRDIGVSAGAFEVRGMLWRLTWPAPFRR